MTEIHSALNPSLGKTRAGERPLNNREVMQRSAAMCAMSSPTPKCTGNIFVGMFFDGTGNNEKIDYLDVKSDPRHHKHSNVVRLLHAHPDQLIIGSNGYYRYYMPGLGTPFPEIGDNGGWLDQKLGSGGGFRGTARVIWGLTRVFNAISRYVYKEDFFNKDDAANLATDSRGHTQLKAWISKLKVQIACRNPQVAQITINVFGFSRGAAEARAFANWLFDLCEAQDGGWLFAGIPLRVQFMGIFDTVASVGIAGVYTFSEGHLSWANRNMQIHPSVEQCVHMVASHEVRSCFPLDSARIEGQYPLNVVEYVYPGSHSDVGGGYVPDDLGKKEWRADDVDGQLARIPGYEMYCVAIAAGVPFLPMRGGRGAFEEMEDPIAKALKPSPVTIKAFDAYMQHAAIVAGPVEDMARQHMSLYFSHRLGVLRTPWPEKARASAEKKEMIQDTQVALLYVVSNLCREIIRRIKQGGTEDEVLTVPEWSHYVPNNLVPSALPFRIMTTVADATRRQHILRHQSPEELQDMMSIASNASHYLRIWRDFLNNGLQADVRTTAIERDGVRLLEALKEGTLPKDVVTFFDELVHDSMAGFIGFGMPEFQVNGLGIAKFRRIFFGNNGDYMLREQVARQNNQRIQEVQVRRANRRQWDAESSGYARTVSR